VLAEFEPVGKVWRRYQGSDAVNGSSLLERITSAAQLRQLSRNTITAYRRTEAT
jgi:hypothetical protein